MDTTEKKYPNLAAAMDLIINRYGSKAEAARKLKTNATSVGYYLEGNREPTLKMLAMIANEVGKSPSELMGINGTLSATEAPDTFAATAMVTGSTVTVQGGQVTASGRTIPVISFAQGGDFNYWTDAYPVGQGMDRLACPPQITDPNAFAFRVEGDSMVPRYFPGEVVVVDTTKDVINNDDVVVRLSDGRVMLKRFRRTNGTILLESYNQAHESIVIGSEEIRKCYKVVCRM
jgi:phage repressor protein C with HTH and peptisase S24 domain